jgi:hypothetical protein
VEYNPKIPSPTYGGSRFNPYDPNTPMGPLDQRNVVENRSDALIYTTEPLIEDVVLNGRVTAELFVSSDKKDTDFGIRLCDVYPDGRSMILTQGIRRMRFRNTYSDEELMTPGEVYPVKIELHDLSVNFLAGHSIKIIITNSNYPMFDINLNNGDSLYVPGDTLIAKTYLHHWGNYKSKIILPITKISGTVSKLKDNNQFEIYPNPTTDRVGISYFLNKSGYTCMELFNLFGEKIKSINQSFQEAGNNIDYLFLSGCPPGVYFLKFNSNEFSFIRKIILTH